MQFLSEHLLTLVTFLPAVGAIILLFFPRPPDEEEAHGHTAPAHGPAVDAAAPGAVIEGEHGEPAALPGRARTSGAADLVRGFAVIVSALTFILSLGLLYGFKAGQPGFQFQEGPAVWLPMFNVSYHLGIDGIGLWLILLTTFLSLLSVIYSWSIKRRIKEYFVFLLVLQTAMTGVFCALDLVLFYVFWEAVLIPMYFLIGIWGHENRLYAAVKFFLYTFAGSILMLVGIVYIYAHTGTFSLADLLPGGPSNAALRGFDPRTLAWLFWAFALAFMIKVPMFPFHTWLPDAHVEAPTAGSVILAGVMLKMGTYGFLRFCLPLFPEQARAYAPLFIILAIIGILYGAIVAAMQADMKRVIAYSSVSHLGFVMLGIFSFTTIGITGATLQNLNHGVSTGMLFFLVGMLYERRHTREIAAYGGIKRAVPILSTFFLIALFSSIALPLTNGFVGEFTILQGSFLSNGPGSGPTATAFATFGMVLSAVYMLWLFQRVFTGPLDKTDNRRMLDLVPRESFVLACLVLFIFWIGCYSVMWTNYLTPPSQTLSQQTAGPGMAARPGHQQVRVAEVRGRR